MAQARTLLTLKDPQKIDAVAQTAVHKGLTVRQLEALVNQPVSVKTKKPPARVRLLFKPPKSN